MAIMCVAETFVTMYGTVSVYVVDWRGLPIRIPAEPDGSLGTKH